MKTINKNQDNKYWNINGDLFESVKNLINGGNSGCSVVVPHVCNNINLFGAGFAGAVSRHFPIVKENFHLLGNKAQLGQTQFVAAYKDKKFGHQLIFANMIAQSGVISSSNRRPLNYLALATCMNNVNNYIKQNFDSENRVQIHAPKFGSGLAGGNWKFIQELIVDIWSPSQNVFIYEK